LLCVIFSRDYQIANGADLLRLTKLAGDYRCLPAVSNSLWGPICTSPGLVSSISNNPCQVLVAAYKLRHERLFKEAFIHVLGPASAPHYTKLAKQTLKNMAHLIHGRFQIKLLEAHQAILNLHANPKKYGAIAADMAKLASQSTDAKGKVLIPMYFRKCFEMTDDKKFKACEEELDQILEPLVTSKLSLDKTGATAGKGAFKDCFLCFEPNIIPWDENQTDW
jgi:hypothetical protein